MYYQGDGTIILKAPNVKNRVFWVNIAISKLNLLYRYCLKLIGELRKEKEFRQQCCRNSTKIRREKEEEFRQHCYRNSSAQISARPVSCVKKSNCSNAIVKIEKKKEIFFLVIVAMALPKMEKKKFEWNYGNVIAENGRKKNICCQNLGRNF